MSFTRFHDDPSRIKKQIDESSFTGRYMLNTPGPGMDLPFNEDPHVRLQKWGANLHKNTTNIESELKNRTIPLGRDITPYNKLKSNSPNYNQTHFSIDETRTTMPAWKLRDAESSRYDYVHSNPQEHIFTPFKHNLNTRILEKDYYTKNKK